MFFFWRRLNLRHNSVDEKEAATVVVVVVVVMVIRVTQ
jgi:hypothetical protein